MTYPSKKDLWIVVIVMAGGILLLGVAVDQLMRSGAGHGETWIMLGAAIFYWAVVSLFAYPVAYTITPSLLLIRSGLFLRYQIPLSSIERVTPTRNPLSAPAWSLDRLRIDYEKKGRSTFALISPQDKRAFLRELSQTVPDLELRGDSAVRIQR